MAFTVGGRHVTIPRIPFFRVFYSLTYTLLYIITLVFLAITPISMIYGSIEQSAYQYTFMIGGGYVVTAILAVFVYSSRIYTNRSVLSAVGKAYIPIEPGEVGNMVRRMIVKQLERSAIVAWEGRPRDLYENTLSAEQERIPQPEPQHVMKDDSLVGTEIRVDPEYPPWGDVQHPGWSSPNHTKDNKTPDVQFDSVIEELPHLIEARAVSLAPPDRTQMSGQVESRLADPAVVEALRRPNNMTTRGYLVQLCDLGLITPQAVGQNFLSQYERARFSGRPVVVEQFNDLMAAFAELISGMVVLEPTVVDEIRAQAMDNEQRVHAKLPLLSLQFSSPESTPFKTPSPPARSPPSSSMSPVTAREGMSSRITTPYLQPDAQSDETLSSVLHRTPEQIDGEFRAPHGYNVMNEVASMSSSTLPSDVGSVLMHDTDDVFG